MTDSAASSRGGNDLFVAPMGLSQRLFPAAHLVPACWLGTGKAVPAGKDDGIWRPGSSFRGAGDIFAAGCDGAGGALAIALAQGSQRVGPDKTVSPEVSDERPFLWVQDRAAMRLGGRPYLPGLPHDLRHRLIHVRTRDAVEALFALEEGIRCRDLAFVIGEIAGNPKQLDFIASRRLVLAAERHGVPLWLVRLDARRDLGAARMRWEVASAPSEPSPWNEQAPGAPRWKAKLFRARGLRPGTWWITPGENADGRNGDAGTHLAAISASAGDLADPAGDRSLAAAAPRR